MRIRSLNMGHTAAEFRLEGAPDAIDAALAGCRTPPAPAGQTSKRTS